MRTISLISKWFASRNPSEWLGSHEVTRTLETVTGLTQVPKRHPQQNRALRQYRYAQARQYVAILALPQVSYPYGIFLTHSKSIT
jgi:hypothetical protein